ncbi:MAG: helix-turn-helix transcriptional regulator [Chroococcidiopsidaceae cyanobacterium CP_BM_RX_35]|nr:helix-turn-helix transcriptional regulator [Chroococcidiopsidaceae cyanobacterium CP_BM_RX_35]
MVRNPKPSVLDNNCGSRQVLALIANKWTAIVIYQLSQGTKRYSELQREIGGVSQKMLTQTLRNLERDGLVERKVYPVIPPMVEYSLTQLGKTLIEPLCRLCEWAEIHLYEVEVARTRYEDRNNQRMN